MATVNLGRVGFVNKGDYVGTSSYKLNDIVTANGALYACVQPVPADSGIVISNESYWQKWIDNKTVTSISELLTTSSEVDTVFVKDYHSGIEGGGGTFVWDATKLKSEHNGGTVIDPTAVFPTDWTNQTQLGTWFDTSNAGTGVWVRKYDGAVNVQWFGAKGDGVTDDTLAIQSSLDFAYSMGNYIEVQIPQSTSDYIFTTLKVKSKTTFKSVGGTLKLKNNTCANPATSYYLIENLGHTDVIYDGLLIDGNRVNNTLFTVADGITAVGSNTVVKNCVIINPPDSGIMFSDCISGSCINNYIEGASDVGIYTNGSGAHQGSIISGNIIENCAVTGIALKRECVGVVVNSNTISDCPNSISCEDFGVGLGGHPSNITITNNLCKSTTNYALVLNRLTNSIVSNNLITDCSSGGISIAGGVNSIISNNIITGSGIEGTSIAGIYIGSRVDSGDATITTSSKLTILANKINSYLGKGIYVESGTLISITSNVVDVGNEALRLNSITSGIVIQQNIIDGGVTLSLYSGASYMMKNNIIGGTLNSGHRTISSSQPTPTSVSSTFTALYIGEEVLHLAANQWFKAYGTGLQEWSMLN